MFQIIILCGQQVASSLDGACGIRDFVAPMSRIPLHFIQATIYFQKSAE